jgi:hypothetical protein
MIHRFGPEFELLTIAFHEVNSPQVSHLTFSQSDNINFPSTVSRNILSSTEDGTPFPSGKLKIPTNLSALATAVTNNLVASAFIYKCLLYNIVTIIVGLKPSNLSDIKESKVTSRYCPKSLNDEGGVIAGHVRASSDVHENSARGALYMHLMIRAAIGPALLQVVADMEDVSNVVSDVLDSMLNATLPRNYHVQDLIAKELQFYPATSSTFENTVRRGIAVSTPPAPIHKKEFNDFVHTTICSFGIHAHDKNITGDCHKPPKGINQCAASI